MTDSGDLNALNVLTGWNLSAGFVIVQVFKQFKTL